MFFAYLHYNGAEPSWAKSLRESGLWCYSPALPLSHQLTAVPEMETFLETKSMAAPAYLNSEAFQLDPALGKPLSEVRSILDGADQLMSTDHLVWRDQWLLSRADAVLVENGASLEIPLLASLWGIRVVAVSFTPTGMHPWLAKCAQITVNSPANSGVIFESLGLQVAEAVPEAVEELDRDEESV